MSPAAGKTSIRQHTSSFLLEQGRGDASATCFAMVEMKIVLSMLLQRFHVQLPESLRVDRIGFPVIRPKRGLPVMVRSQARRFDGPVSVISGYVRDMVTLP